MIISIIVAMADNRIIGLNNQMPWHLPADLAWFKYNTVNKPVIMGRKTFASIGRPLPQRHNIIISRQTAAENRPPRPETTQVSWVNSIDAALELASHEATQEVMIIGGATIYQQLLPVADRLYLTHIEAQLSGDTHFPDYSQQSWHCLFSESHLADSKNPYPYRFEILTRIASQEGAKLAD